MSLYQKLALDIKQIGKNLGFAQVGITDFNINPELDHFKEWLKLEYHGEMKYLEKKLELRENPEKLVPHTMRAICCSIDYPKSTTPSHPIAAFAQIQNYSPYIKNLLTQYVAEINNILPATAISKVFAGNGPVLEKPLAAHAGLGWCGNNTLLINQTHGSYFFLGEIFINLPLPIDHHIQNHCGNCTQCLINCPTKALVAPKQLDATKCISYLTIEYKGSIPIELRPLIGTRIFGCDCCQQHCPWNKNNYFDSPFKPLESLLKPDLLTWFLWTEKEFIATTKDTPIGRISHEQWLRNIAIALGNSTPSEAISAALTHRLNHHSALVKEHVEWAINHALSTTNNSPLQKKP